MKAIRSITFAALAIAGAGTAFSQTTIRIVGSNGDRTATQTAISHLLASGWVFQGTSGSTSSAGLLATATNANFGAWKGSYAGNQVIIKVSFSGALAGISAVAGNTDQRFVVTDGTGSGTVASPLTGTLGVTYEIGKADFGFSTNFQSTSPFNGVYQGVTYSSVVQEVVGVSPLGFYASPGFPGDNITTQLAQQLYKSGWLSAQLFTGSTADLNKTVWAIGRNTDAGQRFGAYTEIGLGTSAVVSVWQPTISGQTTDAGTGIKHGGTSVSQVAWPAETISGIFSPTGSGGYSSGALLTEPLTTTLASDVYKGKYIDPEDSSTQFLAPNATAGYYIGYVTPGDGNSRIIPFGGISLKYNGVALTDDNVRNGRYTAWLYNRILKSTTFNNTPSLKRTFANALRDQIATVDAPSGGGLFNDSTFKVERFTDGGIVTLKP